MIRGELKGGGFWRRACVGRQAIGLVLPVRISHDITKGHD
jgi:hypothetical protein